MLFRDGKHLTLAEVFQSINLTAYDLSIDTLDMHVSIFNYDLTKLCQFICSWVSLIVMLRPYTYRLILIPSTALTSSTLNIILSGNHV